MELKQTVTQTPERTFNYGNVLQACVDSADPRPSGVTADPNTDRELAKLATNLQGLTEQLAACQQDEQDQEFVDQAQKQVAEIRARIETLGGRERPQRAGTEVVVDVTAEIARVSQTEGRCSPDATMDLRHGEDASAGGAQDRTPMLPVRVTGLEGGEKTTEEGTLDEFLIGSTAQQRRAAARRPANADIALVHMSDKCISPQPFDPVSRLKTGSALTSNPFTPPGVQHQRLPRIAKQPAPGKLAMLVDGIGLQTMNKRGFSQTPNHMGTSQCHAAFRFTSKRGTLAQKHQNIHLIRLERLRPDQPPSIRTSPRQGNLKVLDKNKGVVMPTHYDTVSVFDRERQTAEGIRTMQTSKLTQRNDSCPSPPLEEPNVINAIHGIRSTVRIPQQIEEERMNASMSAGPKVAGMTSGDTSYFDRTPITVACEDLAGNMTQAKYDGDGHFANGQKRSGREDRVNTSVDQMVDNERTGSEEQSEAAKEQKLVLPQVNNAATMLGGGSKDTVHFGVLGDGVLEHESGRSLQPGSSLGRVAGAGGPEESQGRMTFISKPVGAGCNLAPISHAIGNDKGHQATEGVSSHSHPVSCEQRPSLYAKRPALGASHFRTDDQRAKKQAVDYPKIANITNQNLGTSACAFQQSPVIIKNKPQKLQLDEFVAMMTRKADQKHEQISFRDISGMDLGASPTSAAVQRKLLGSAQYHHHHRLVNGDKDSLFKQIQSLSKEQQIVISHPYDLSQTIQAQKSFVSQRKPAYQLRALVHDRDLPSTATPTSRYAHQAQRSPRQAKQEWLREALWAKEWHRRKQIMTVHRSERSATVEQVCRDAHQSGARPQQFQFGVEAIEQSNQDFQTMKVDRVQLHHKQRHNHSMLHAASSYGDSGTDTKDIFAAQVKRATPQLQVYEQHDTTYDSVQSVVQIQQERKIESKKNQNRYAADVDNHPAKQEAAVINAQIPSSRNQTGLLDPMSRQECTLQNSRHSIAGEKDPQTGAATAALQSNETEEEHLDEQAPLASAASTQRPGCDAQLHGDAGFQQRLQEFDATGNVQSMHASSMNFSFQQQNAANKDQRRNILVKDGGPSSSSPRQIAYSSFGLAAQNVKMQQKVVNKRGTAQRRINLTLKAATFGTGGGGSRRAGADSLLRSGQSSGNGSPIGCLPPSPRALKLSGNQSGDQFVPIGRHYVNRQLRQSLAIRVDEHKGSPATRKSPKASTRKWQDAEALGEEDENARSTSPPPPKQERNTKVAHRGKVSPKKKPRLHQSPPARQTPLILRALFEDDAEEENPSAWLNTNTSQYIQQQISNQTLSQHVAGAGVATEAANLSKSKVAGQGDPEETQSKPAIAYNTPGGRQQEIRKVETLEILRTAEEPAKPELARVQVTLDNIDINQLGPMYIQKNHRSRRASPISVSPRSQALQPTHVEFLRQVTLYKMQDRTWKTYEKEWQTFSKSDHLVAQAPIPPNTRVLPLHIYLQTSNKSIQEMKAYSDLAKNLACLYQCFNEAKRRLQMCSFRIMDHNLLIEQKAELNEGFRQLTNLSEREEALCRREGALKADLAPPEESTRENPLHLNDSSRLLLLSKAKLSRQASSESSHVVPEASRTNSREPTGDRA